MMITTNPSELAPELLLLIMNYLPEAAVAAAAVTCQAWKEPASDILWREVNLRNLLSVLAPVGLQGDNLLVSGLPNFRHV